MNRVSLGLAALVVLVAASACHRHRGAKTGKTSNEDPVAMNGAEESGGTMQSAPTGAGSCDASCQHYLQCKGNGDPNVQAACVAKCGQMHLARASLLAYEASDCASAIRAVEGAPAGQHNGANGSGAAGSADCNGCVWDGSSCFWLSSGNWGAGPYSGAASDCDARCCAAH